MKSNTTKVSDNNSNAIANNLSAIQDSEEKKSATGNNHIESNPTSKLQALANNSTQVRQLASLQAMANQYSTKQNPRNHYNFNQTVQLARRGHQSSTYEVTITHSSVNNGNPVYYYRNNVLGHPNQRAVIAAALQQFQTTNPGLVGAPTRNGRSINGNPHQGATAV
jgi:hypothetical protein